MVSKALIVGAGSGVSASFARALSRSGARVALAARNTEKLETLVSEIKGQAYQCDATSPDQVADLFSQLDKDMGAPDAVLYNVSAYTAGSITTLDPELVHNSLLQTAYGAFLVAQQAAGRLLKAGGGAIFFTGATASVKGFPQFAPFAMGKFALRGLTQSLARELGPKNIHVAHFIIDGSIASLSDANGDDAKLNPDAIAETYMAVLNQHRSAWSQEIDIRPWKESF